MGGVSIGNRQHITHYDVPQRALFDVARLHRPDLGLELRPSFSIGPDDRIFVIGSCFAREIDAAMSRVGFAVGGGPLGNKYNNFSMLQALNWLLGEAQFDERLIAPMSDGRWFDGHRHPVEYHASAADAIAAHRDVLDSVRTALVDADVVVMTLGLVEAWRDHESGAWLNCTPPVEVRGYISRYEMVQTTHAANLRALLDVFSLLQSRKRRRVVCSVSPVPLFATFTDDDVLVANMYSKSTLRSVVGEAISQARSEFDAAIDYFPSYELAMLSPRERVWRERHLTGEPDGRHVKPEFVRDVIVRMFMDRYVCEAGGKRRVVASVRG